MSEPKPPALAFPAYIPFVEHLGFELHRFGGGEAELQLELQPAHLNSFCVAHGGVVMTLLDVAMAHAARAGHGADPFAAPGVVTIEMKTSFMRPGEGRLRAVGRMLDRSRTLAFCEASLLAPDGRLCAHATGTFKYLRALPGRERAIKPFSGPQAG